MKSLHWVFLALVVLLATPALAEDRPASFADLVEKLSPAVVNISTTQKVKGQQGVPFGMPFQGFPDTPEFEPFREFFDRFGQMQGGQPAEREVTSLGSGFIIDASGYVITNNHVIDAADEITVTTVDNTKYKAAIVGRDSKTDLALLKVESKKPLPFVAFGSSDAMRVGDWVIAIGNPFGLGGSVTQGIISARARSINAGPFDDFLQTDAPINRGNSGGPLFNLKGEVIGINTAIFSPTGGSIGIGFAIPTALAKPVIEQLKASGHVVRGWLGVRIQEVSEDIAESVGLPKPAGALILETAKGGPADKAGLMAGDVITAFDGKDIAEMRHLPRIVAETKIGKTVSVTYWRKNISKNANVVIGKLEESEEGDAAKSDAGKQPKNSKSESEAVLGMEVMPLNQNLRKRLGLDEKLNGLVVTGVKPGSEAAQRGMGEGVVILDVNGTPVKTVPDFKAAFEAAKKQGRKFALVRVLQNKEEAFVPLPTSEEMKK
jgi:serine protease Do